jgi:hypothetical protein
MEWYGPACRGGTDILGVTSRGNGQRLQEWGLCTRLMGEPQLLRQEPEAEWEPGQVSQIFLPRVSWPFRTPN